MTKKNLYAQHTVSATATPISEPIPGREAEMGVNNGGGVAFKISNMSALRRFLILGTDGGTYYLSEKAHTLNNIRVVEYAVRENARAVLTEVVDIATKGRAMKKDAAIYTLAYLIKRAENVAVRQEAAKSVNLVCSIGTDILMLAQFIEAMGGWGRNTHRAFETWYNMPPEDLAFQAMKYQSRNGWSHRDVLRKVRPKPQSEDQRAVLRWITKGWEGDLGIVAPEDATRRLWAFEVAKTLTDTPQDVARCICLINDYRLPRECVPTHMLNHKEVWEALLQSMGPTALVRNLGKMTNVGLLVPLSQAAKTVAGKLKDPEFVKKGKLHPLRTLVALKLYAQGHGDKGSLSWAPVPQIKDALDTAFYNGFSAIEPTGKNHLLALDVSGSMSSRMGTTPLTCHEATAALAMIRARVEENYYAMGFSNVFVDLGITKSMTLGQAMERTHRSDFGATHCALPANWAADNRIEVDVFEIYTDNECNFGGHPTQALQRYRDKMGRDVRQVVCGMTSTGFSIADPGDPKQLDVVGFDAALPEIVNNFLTL